VDQPKELLGLRCSKVVPNERSKTVKWLMGRPSAVKACSTEGGETPTQTAIIADIKPQDNTLEGLTQAVQLVLSDSRERVCEVQIPIPGVASRGDGDIHPSRMGEQHRHKLGQGGITNPVILPEGSKPPISHEDICVLSERRQQR